jgi:AmmeMemoRadiSam system protein A
MSQSLSPGASLEPLPAPELNPQERKALLHLAHDAILSTLQHRDLKHRDMASSFNFSGLDLPRGAFTTIYLHGKLRGCVGYPLAIASLRQTIIETARGAAFNDVRFAAVTLPEARELEISLSILSPLRTIRPEDVIIGLHGVLLSQDGRRGLFLPQVPVEHGWDRVSFLEQTCRKAGLPTNAWKSGAKVEAFTAEVFGDPGSETFPRD